MMKKEEMDKILEIERKLAEAKNGMVKEIASDVGNQTMDGVNRIGKNAFTVSFSAIDASDGFILSPDYYSSDSQAQLVKNRLKNAAKNGGMENILKAIEEMVEKKSVVVNKKSYRLNPCTVSVLDGVLAETG